MDHVHILTLLVITHLNSCRTEILTNRVPESWYSANVINEGSFSPQSISDIFSSEMPLFPTSNPPKPTFFSSTNPIVVLPSSTTSPVTDSSPWTSVETISPGIQETVSTPPSSTPLPTTGSVATLSSTVSITPPPTSPTTPLQRQTTLSQSIPSLQPIQIQFPPQTQLPQPVQIQFAPQPPSPPQLPPLPPAIQPVRSTAMPNYFLIYQQAPQSIQNFRDPIQPRQLRPMTFSPPTTRIVSSSRLPSPVTISNTPATTRMQPPLPVITTIRSTPAPCATTSQPRVTANTINTSSSLPLVPLVSQSLKIRVVAPSGSITNVRINPTSSTRKPTTTRTRRTQRAKRNDYDECVRSCKGRREPICAVPSSNAVIDPNTLKGFPSICHMACHNSFKRDVYEKIVDGRCGKLRTRIRTVDSNKIKRDELNKAQYTVVHNAPQTVVEFDHRS